jgi:Fe-S-cluster formation regulator IscX/YfhJ
VSLSGRTKLILVAVAAFLGGAVSVGIAGWYAATYFTSHFFADGWMLGNSVDAQIQVSILKNLRDGETKKAIELLETTLDEKIISLQTFDENAQSTNESVAKAIQIAREYRTKHPRSTQYPDVDKMVSKVLNQDAK